MIMLGKKIFEVMVAMIMIMLILLLLVQLVVVVAHNCLLAAG